ncbi:hypothetical protein H4R35_002537 [Dimargaris xerosporica]|nr:hypothetical protein H4R35_002537 [Dimargaris xerosporica]
MNPFLLTLVFEVAESHASVVTPATADFADPEDQVAPEALEQLGRDPVILEALQSEATRQIIVAILNSAVPEQALEEAIRDLPEFDTFKERLLMIVKHTPRSES